MEITDLLIAFGGGILGAALGALAAFELVGLLVIILVVIQLASGAPSDFVSIPFGYFGPHVGGFAAGVAATAYAAKKGMLDSGRNILTGLCGLGCANTLLIGGVFGIIGFLCVSLLNQVPAFSSGLAWTDTVAFSVVISGILVRFAFGTTGLFGKPENGISRLMPPIEKCWMPYHSRLAQLITLGCGIGLFAGYLGISLGSNGVLLAFGISAFSLIFLHFNTSVPISHHISLPAATTALLSGSLIWAAIVGIICALLGELISRLFLIHGDTHIDPPAFVIFLMTTVIHFLTTANVFTTLAML
ncbi:hypothetical protein ACUHGC_00785 [Testudinibacter sp. P27/CKL/0425]